MKRESVAMACMVVLMSYGCTKDPLKNLTDEESRVYITQRDNTINFTSFHTFYIADSVAYISNSGVTSRYAPVDAKFIASIKSQLEQRGFIPVAKNQQPDIGVTVSRIYNTYQGIVEYSNYYDNYWDPFYWGYGSSSYYFPSYYGVYQVTEGALSIDILNLKDARTTNRIGVIWNGLIRGSGIFNEQSAASQVEALFDQSPYLKSL